MISYFTSNDDEFQFINPDSNRFPIWGNQRLAIEAISNIAKSLGLFLIVRVHPNLKNKSIIEQKRWNDLGEKISSKGFTLSFGFI